MATSLLMVNGPNLNLLGTREPEVYGATTLAEIEQQATAQAKAAGALLNCFQSNHEGELIDRIHVAKKEGVQAIIINPGALTHTSVALRDALADELKAHNIAVLKEVALAGQEGQQISACPHLTAVVPLQWISLCTTHYRCQKTRPPS